MMSFKIFPTMLRACGGAAVLAFSVTGCDLNSLLEVSDPSRLLAEDVEVPSQADALVNGLEADFLCALSAQYYIQALISDEFEDHGANGDSWPADRRRGSAFDTWADNDCTSHPTSIYVPAGRSRWVADNLVTLMSGWTDAEVDDRAERIARAYLLGGFSLAYIGMTQCSGTIDVGPELTRDEIFGEAEDRFTLAMSGGTADITSAARLGRARVRMYMGDDANALTDAAAVPPGFVMSMTPASSTARLSNTVWRRNIFGTSVGVPVWTQALTTGGVLDPRTLTYNTLQSSGWGPGVIFGQMKHMTATSPMPFARYEEAQLIIAEITGGATAVAVINALRAPYPTLPVFASTSEPAIQAEIALERQRELWFEGFRMHDIGRLNLAFVPPVDTPYQVGIKGGTYGSGTCLPIPQTETFNNPNFNR